MFFFFKLLKKYISFCLPVHLGNDTSLQGFTQMEENNYFENLPYKWKIGHLIFLFSLTDWSFLGLTICVIAYCGLACSAFTMSQIWWYSVQGHKLFLSMRSFSIVDPYGLFFSVSETFGNQSHAVSNNLIYLFHINFSLSTIAWACQRPLLLETIYRE